MLTIHPSHGRDEGPIGPRADCYEDGRAHRWSWKCWCGEWDDGYQTRHYARLAYDDHRRSCLWAKRRKPQLAEFESTNILVGPEKKRRQWHE